MTTRRRRPTTSGSDSRPDTSTTNRPSSTGGGTSGDGVNVDTDGMDNMAGRLQNTGGRVDAVGSTLDGVNVGPQSMGIIGSGFTGTAQSHVQAARQHVTRARSAVQQAQDGTRATAQSYRDTDTNNATNLSSIDPDTNTPTPSGSSGTTSPSGSTTDSGGGASSPPPPPRDTGGTPPPGDQGGPGGPGDPPAPPRSPTGDDGGWRGENGLQLTQAQNAAANDFLDRARQAEPGITRSMQDISNSVPGSQMVGLDYRLKTDESFKRKLATAIQENPDLTMAEHLADMKDSVRYTMQVEPGNYTSGVQHAVDTLQSQGYENVKFKNTWDSSGYQGINSMWRDPATGQVFEVQFHTQDSFDAKMVTHDLYEQARLPGVDDATRQRLDQQQADVFNNVPRPEGASDIRVGGSGRG